MEAVVLAHRIRHLPSLPAVAVEGGVGLVVHVVEGEEVTVPAALVAVAWGLAHLLSLLILAHGHVLTAETKSKNLGRRRIKHVRKNVLPLVPNHALIAENQRSRKRTEILRKKGEGIVLHLVHVHALKAEIENKNLGGVLASHLQQKESVGKVPWSHLPPFQLQKMKAELVRKMPIMKRTLGEDFHRREEVDLTPAAEVAAGVAEGGAHPQPHQAVKVKLRRGERDQGGRDHGLRPPRVTVEVGAGVEVMTAAAKKVIGIYLSLIIYTTNTIQ